MKPLLSVLLIALAGCSGFHFFSNFPATSVTSVSGFVTIVHLGSVANNGTFISVTSITFVQSGAGTTVSFCGNVVNQFPLNTTVRVDFTPGTPCSTVGAIVVISG